MKANLLEEFLLVIRTLNDANLPYALCGGFAVAVHGIPRATIDIDLLVPLDALAEIKCAVGSIGYKLETHLDVLAGGKVQMTRLTKFFMGSEDFVCLDLLHATGPLESLFHGRRMMETEDGQIWVLTKEAIVQMKLLRNSEQDKADIASLERLPNES